MALAGRLEKTLEIKSPAERFYSVWKKTPFDIPNHTPSNIQAVQLHDEEWETFGHGSIKTWNFTTEGKSEIYKARVEFDDEKMCVTHVGLDGHPLKLYKTYKAIFQVTPKGTGSFATLSIDYEKLNPNVPEPHKYLDVMVGMTKDMDAALTKA